MMEERCILREIFSVALILRHDINLLGGRLYHIALPTKSGQQRKRYKRYLMKKDGRCLGNKTGHGKLEYAT